MPLLLAGCGIFLDGDQVRLCRQTLPVLAAGGARLAVLDVRPAESVEGVRIQFQETAPEQGPRVRAVVCGFGGGGVATRRNQLTALVLDGRALNDGELHMLRRFWLESVDAAPADPGPGLSVGAAPAVSEGVGVLLQHVLSSLPLISSYALLATAYALIYGLIGRINLAFGEFAALGGVAAVIGVALGLAGGWTSAVPAVLLAAGAALFVTTGHAAVIARLVLLPLSGRTGQQALVATAGLAIALQEYMRLSQGNGTRWMAPLLNDPVVVARAPAFAVTVTPVALLVSAAGALVATGVLLLLSRSRFGRSWRAVADDPGAAELFGISRRASTARPSRSPAASRAVPGSSPRSSTAGWAMLAASRLV